MTLEAQIITAHTIDVLLGVKCNGQHKVFCESGCDIAKPHRHIIKCSGGPPHGQCEWV